MLILKILYFEIRYTITANLCFLIIRHQGIEIERKAFQVKACKMLAYIYGFLSKALYKTPKPSPCFLRSHKLNLKS